MHLKPLQQWMCDQCGEIIEKPDDGWVEWVRDAHHKVGSFRIVHHESASPIAKKNTKQRGFGDPWPSCYDDSQPHSNDHLDHMLGPDGIVDMLSMFDVGGILDPVGESITLPTRSWVETFRRLHVPYYEEARLYFAKADEDGFFEGANEVSPYLQRDLKRIIEKYGR